MVFSKHNLGNPNGDGALCGWIEKRCNSSRQRFGVAIEAIRGLDEDQDGDKDVDESGDENEG